MAKSTERKTKVNTASVDDFIDAQPSEQVRDDCRTLVALMEQATGAPAEMWGSSIVGLRSLPMPDGERQDDRVDDHRVLATEGQSDRLSLAAVRREK